MRMVALFVLLALLLGLPFLFWGEGFEAAWGGSAAIGWLREQGPYAWMAAIGLLVADLFLPLPASGIMAALGVLYGALIGGLIAALGSFLSGSLGYALCRLLGRRAARRLLGERDLERGARLFTAYGGWLVAASRALPLLPEVVACAAGLLRMPAPRFFAALACGAVPVGMGFAWLGSAGADRPLPTLAVAVLLPVALWLAVDRLAGARLSGAADPALEDEGEEEGQGRD
jgi:uncharacterized membrane protein YdjX (TVP38/TMEM64 family)